MWSFDVDGWKEEEIKFLRRDVLKGDVDDFGVLKRFVDYFIKLNWLVKIVFIYNLICLVVFDKFIVINCMWLI